jgi:hypothetical protein
MEKHDLMTHVSQVFRHINAQHRQRGLAAGVGAAVGAGVGSILGGTKASAIGAAIGGALGVAVIEKAGVGETADPSQ